MQKFHVKKGDEVVVIAGTEAASAARSSRSRARKQRVIVEGVKMIKTPHAQEPEATRRARLSSGKEPIHISNVMLAERFRCAARAKAPAPADEPNALRQNPGANENETETL